MNRKLLTYFEGVVVIRAKGKRIERFLSYIYKLKINLLDIKYIDRQNVLIKIFNRDFDKVKGIKTTFEINVVGYEGKLRLKEGIKEHLLLLLSIIIGYLFLLFLSNVIFDVEVVHSNASVRKLIAVELAERNIKRWHFKKSFNELQQTKEQILNEYKDHLEWLEIETVGTKYIVKVEERKIKKIVDDYEYQDIVSAKNAIILRIDAIEGEIVKRKNDYVKKGDIIISGRIMKGQEVS
ncbi:MAG: sporulation protein YqfD, partial [Bacilli bacterium]|nr:sporulation protein YqfD [Bacilli bacterium]